MTARWDDLFDRAAVYEVSLETVTDRCQQRQDTEGDSDG